MFSNSNPNFSSIGIDFSSHQVFIEQQEAELAENYPCPLTRQTNDWSLFYGAYPTHCAFITAEEEIERRLSSGERHVACIRIEENDDRVMRRDVVRKVGELVAQLEKFSAEGLIWGKTPGRINLDFDSDLVVLRIYVCNDSGMLHVLADGTTSEKLNKIIYSIRHIYKENDPLPSFASIHLTPETWEATYDVTREHTMAHVSFPLRVENVMGDEDESPIKKRRLE